MKSIEKMTQAETNEYLIKEIASLKKELKVKNRGNPLTLTQAAANFGVSTTHLLSIVEKLGVPVAKVDNNKYEFGSTALNRIKSIYNPQVFLKNRA